MAGRSLNLLRGLVLVLPLVLFIAEPTDGVELLQPWEAGQQEELLQVSSSQQGGEWTSVPSLRMPGAAVEFKDDDGADLGACQSFCSERNACLAVSWSVEHKECFWSVKTLNYDSGFTLYVSDMAGQFQPYPGIKQLDDPLAPPFIGTITQCQKRANDARAMAYSYNSEKRACFTSKAGLHVDPKFTYYEKNSDKAIANIGGQLEAANEKMANFANEGKTKAQEAAHQANLRRLEVIQKQKIEVVTKEKSTKKAAEQVVKGELVAKNKAKNAVVEGKHKKIAVVKEKARKELEKWKANKQAAADKYDKAVEVKKLAAMDVARITEELEEFDRKVSAAVRLVRVRAAVRSSVETGKVLSYVQSVQAQKVVPPTPIQDIKSRLTAVSLKASKSATKILEIEGELKLAKAGVESPAAVQFNKDIARNDLRLVKMQVAMEMAPTPTLTSEHLELEAINNGLKAKLKTEIARTTVKALTKGYTAEKETLAVDKELVKKSNKELVYNSQLPIIPSGPGGVTATPPVALPPVPAEDVQDASNADSTELIKAGENVEGCADREEQALSDLAAGKGETAKMELGEARKATDVAVAELAKTQKAVLKANPAVVLSQKTEIKEKIAAGVPAELASSEAQRDEHLRKLAEAQNKLEHAMQKEMKAMEVLEMSAAFGQHEKFVLRAKRKEVEAKKESASKETTIKIHAKKIAAVEAANKKESAEKKAEEARLERSVKESSSKKARAAAQAAVKEQEAKERSKDNETPEAAAVAEAAMKSQVKINSMKNQERKVKLERAVAGIKAYNHAPKKRAVYEAQFDVLKGQLSAGDMQAAIAAKKEADAGKEIRIAREKVEKIAVAAALATKNRQIALKKEAEAQAAAAIKAEEESKQAAMELERRIERAARMTGEAKAKADMKINEGKDKMAERQMEAQRREQAAALTREKSEKAGAKEIDQKSGAKEIKTKNDAEKNEIMNKHKKFVKEEAKRKEREEQLRERMKRHLAAALRKKALRENRIALKKENRSKNAIIKKNSAESVLVYNSFDKRFNDKIARAKDHEAAQKHLVSRPFSEELKYKALMAKKEMAAEMAAKKKRKTDQELKRKDAKEKNLKAKAQERFQKDEVIAQEKSKKKQVASKNLEKKEKAVEKAKKQQEKAVKSKSAAEKESADKKAAEVKAKEIKAFAIKEKSNKKNAAAIAVKVAEHKRMLKLASGFPKARPQNMNFKRLGEKVRIFKMAPKVKVRVVKVGDVCMAEGVVKLPSGDTQQPVLAFLPEECRPNRRLIFNVARIEEESAVSTVRVDVLVSGEIIAVTKNEPGAIISMDSITFTPQGSKTMTMSQERLCKGWKRPPPAPPEPPPDPPVGIPNWGSAGCWLDGGGVKGGRRLLSAPEDPYALSLRLEDPDNKKVSERELEVGESRGGRESEQKAAAKAKKIADKRKIADEKKSKAEKLEKILAEKKKAVEVASKRSKGEAVFTPANLLGYNNKIARKRTDAIRDCAVFAARKNVPYFSLQNNGHCYLQTTPNQNFEKWGMSKFCAQGGGGRDSNDVYEVLPKLVEPKIENPKNTEEADGMGCYTMYGKKMKALKPIKGVKGIEDCKAFAMKKEWSYFGVGPGQTCLTSSGFKHVYLAEKPSSKCINNNGGKKQVSVFRMTMRTPFDYTTATDIALGRPTSQTSVRAGKPSWFAVDGNHTSCANTQAGTATKKNWWRVDLMKRANVQAISVVAGKKGLEGFAIHVSDTSFFRNSRQCGIVHKSIAPGKSKTINCDQEGKYAFITSLTTVELELCEVQVWAGGTGDRKAPPVKAPPPPPKPLEFGSRRRSFSTSTKPKGKKLLKLTEVKLLNKWKNADSGYAPAQLNEQGSLCMLSGVIMGPSLGEVVQLPATCIPKHTLTFMLNAHHDQMKVTVDKSGVVRWAGGSSENNWISLSGISFSTSAYHRKLTLKNGWINFDTKRYPKANYVVENRVCVLGGLIFAGKFDVVGVLDAACRPRGAKVFNAPTGTDLDKVARLNIYPDGRIVWVGGSQTSAFLSLNGITFPTQRYKAPKRLESKL